MHENIRLKNFSGRIPYMLGSIKKAVAALLMLLVPTLGLHAGRIKVKIGKVKGRVPKKVQAKRAQRKLNQKRKAKAARIRKVNAARKTRPKAKVTSPKTTNKAPTEKASVAKPKAKASAWTVKDGTAKVRGADGTLREIAPTKVNGKNAAFVPEGGRVKGSWQVKGKVVKQRLKDGSVMHVSPNGVRTRVYPSGRRITILQDGTAVSTNALGQKVVRLPDGRMVINPGKGKVASKLPKTPAKIAPPAATPGKTPRGIRKRHLAAATAVGAGLLLWPTEIGEDDFDQFGPPAQPPADDHGDDAIPGLDPDPGADVGEPHQPGQGDQDQTRRTRDRVRRDQDRTHQDQDQDQTHSLQEDDKIPGFDDLIIQDTVVIHERRVIRKHQDQDQDSRH
jgi:hypothetical protein